jgi:hypothetical protein
MNSLPKTHHYHQLSFTHHHSSLQTSFSTFSFPLYSSSPLLLPSIKASFSSSPKNINNNNPFQKPQNVFFPIAPNPFQQQLLFEQPTYVTARDIFFF